MKANLNSIKQQKDKIKDIDNLSAFLIKAVEEGWSKPIKKEGTKNVSSINSNFTERQYTDEDYKKMMKTLLQ